jgi:virginiamycin B lyase
MYTERRSGMTSRRYLRRWFCLLVSITVGFVLVGAVLLWSKAYALSAGMPRAESSLTASAAPGDSFVFRFDPVLQGFEVFTIPTTGATPDGIAVSDHWPYTTEVWFAESGADRIGRLTYTGTTDYTLQEYELPAGSRPLNVVVDDAGRAWFTENGRNRIGRIDNATGVLDEFVISTTNVAPMDLDIAPDDSIWFTERDTDHIGQLVVNTTADYQVHEFHVERTDAGLSGILVEGDDEIWVVLSNYNRLARLQPSVPRVDRTGPLTPTPAYPLMLAASPDRQRLWFTELYGNRISGVFVSTLQFGMRYSVPTSNSLPYDLDVDSTGAVWFSEQVGGKVGRLVLTTTAAFTEFPVPLPRARIQGLAVDSNDVVWFVAGVPYDVYLPLVMR